MSFNANDSGASRRVKPLLVGTTLVGLVAAGGVAAWKLRPANKEASTASLVIPSPEEDRWPELSRALYAARQSPNSAELAVEAGGIAGEMRQYRQALTLFERAEKLNPTLLAAITGQGQMWSALRRPGRASKCYERALKLAPNEPSLLLALARSYVALRDFPAALRYAQEAEKVAGGDPDVYRTLSLLYGELVMGEESLKNAARACELSPKDPDSWVLQGSQQLKGQHYAEAEASLQKALALEPANSAANLYYAQALIDGRKTTEADRIAYAHLTRVRMVDPNNAQALAMMGGILSRAGKVTQAVSTLRQAREAAPNDSQVLIALGQALTKNRQGEEGVRLVTKGQQLGPKGVGFLDLEELVRKNPDPALALRLVDLYERQEMTDQAIHVLEKALVRNPNHPRLKARLAVFQSRTT